MVFALMGDPRKYGDSLFDIILVYVKGNKVGGHLYTDPSKHIVIKMESHPQPLKPIEMVMFKGDKYVHSQGTMFSITLGYEYMNAQGIMHQTKASLWKINNERT